MLGESCTEQVLCGLSAEVGVDDDVPATHTADGSSTKGLHSTTTTVPSSQDAIRRLDVEDPPSSVSPTRGNPSVGDRVALASTDL